METLAEFIWKRLSELIILEAEARAHLEEIDTERTQLRLAAVAAGIATDAPPEPSRAANAKEGESRRGPATIRKLPQFTLKQGVLLVLSESEGTMLALDILNSINKRFNVNFPRTSLSPQLSRLKDEQLLVLVGREWSLTDKGRIAANALSERERDIFS